MLAFESMSLVSVAVASLLAVAVESMWYSPVFFGKILSKTTPHVFEDDVTLHPTMIMHLVRSVLAHAVLFVCAVYFYTLLAEAMTLAYVSVALASLFAAGFLVVVVLERRPSSYFFVHALYMLCILMGGMNIIIHWPW